MHSHIEPTERRTAMDYRFAFISRDYRQVTGEQVPTRPARRSDRRAN
jgi:hypothetical protein